MEPYCKVLHSQCQGGNSFHTEVKIYKRVGVSKLLTIVFLQSLQLFLCLWEASNFVRELLVIPEHKQKCGGEGELCVNT